MSRTDGIIASAKKKHEITDARVEAAANEMLQEGVRITKYTLSKRAGVSWTYINKSEKWSAFVENHTDKSQETTRVENDWTNFDARLEVAHEAYQSLRTKYDTLKSKYDDLYSKMTDTVRYMDSIADLKARIKDLEQTVQKQKAEIADKNKQLAMAYIYQQTTDLSKCKKKYIGQNDLNEEV